MTNSQSNILIVCWDFPPKDGIGGRRWAKLAKSFVRLGMSVSVVSNFPARSGEKLRWIDETTFSRIKRYHCKAHFLTRWLHDRSSILSAFKVRIAGFCLRVLHKGTIYDKALGVENEFLNLAVEIIQKDKINLVFVTGAPFNLMYYAAKLKKKWPQLKLVCDYRDPWLGARNYGMSNLGPMRLRHEKYKQDTVFEQADYITAPNTFLLDEIKAGYSGRSSRLARFMELPHAFDPDDVVANAIDKTPGRRPRIVYAGTLYLGSDEYLALLNESINHIKKSGSGHLPDVRFYTSETGKASIFSGNMDLVTVNDPIGGKVFHTIADADLIVILLAEHNKNYLTSKFFEFLPYGKPYLYIGPKGFVSDKIVNEKLGFFLRKPDDLAFILDTELRAWQPATAMLDASTFDAVAESLLRCIQN